MSIFDVEEKRLIEQEKEQVEIIASNEYQKELKRDKPNVKTSRKTSIKFDLKV